MAQRISRKELKQQDEFVERGFDFLAWVEENRTVVLGVGAAFLAVFVLVAGWTFFARSRERTAARVLGEGLALYARAAQPEAPPDLLEQARRKFAEAKGGSRAGQAAAFYEGAAVLRQGKAADAAPLLEKAAEGADSGTIADSARALAAQAYEEAGDLEKAAAAWRALSDDPDSLYPPDMALLHLGDVRSRQGKADEATAAWREALARAPQGAAAQEAQQRLGPTAGGTPPVSPLQLQ